MLGFVQLGLFGSLKCLACSPKHNACSRCLRVVLLMTLEASQTSGVSKRNRAWVERKGVHMSDAPCSGARVRQAAGSHQKPQHVSHQAFAGLSRFTHQRPGTVNLNAFLAPRGRILTSHLLQL